MVSDHSFFQPLPLRTNHPAAEIAAWTLHVGIDILCHCRGTENGPAEVFLKPVGDIGPEMNDLLCLSTFGIDFHHGAAIDHGAGKIGTMMDGDWGHRTMLR